MKVYFATSNEGKVEKARQALKKFGIEVEQIAIDLIESRAEDPADIAMEKAKQAFAELGKPVIVEDSGFFIEALNGFPMTHIKFSLKTLGIANILKLLEGVANRNAEWRMSLVFVRGENDVRTFTYVKKGEIATEIRPVNRPMMSDYWRIYISKMIPGNMLALSEASDESLKIEQEDEALNNQFMMFGRWFVEQGEK